MVVVAPVADAAVRCGIVAACVSSRESAGRILPLARLRLWQFVIKLLSARRELAVSAATLVAALLVMLLRRPRRVVGGGRQRGDQDRAALGSSGVETRNASVHSWAPRLCQGVRHIPGVASIEHRLSQTCLERLRAGLEDGVAGESMIGPSLCALITDSPEPFLLRAGCDWNEDSLFRIYSMTKPIVASAFLILLDRGLVHLDDPVAQYLPCFGRPQVLCSTVMDRVDFLDQVQRNVFGPCKVKGNGKGATTADGWTQLSYILRAPLLRRRRISEQFAVRVLEAVDTVELRTDGQGTVWVRRSGRELVDRERERMALHSDCEPAARAITLRMLLAHTAGLGYDSSMYRAPPAVTHRMYGELARDVEARVVSNLSAWVERLAQIPLLCQPGERFEYGYGMDVIGRVIEVVSACL